MMLLQKAFSLLRAVCLWLTVDGFGHVFKHVFISHHRIHILAVESIQSFNLPAFGCHSGRGAHSSMGLAASKLLKL
jgi:hypothetical protein